MLSIVILVFGLLFMAVLLMRVASFKDGRMKLRSVRVRSAAVAARWRRQ
jgi:hypothetical protein